MTAPVRRPRSLDRLRAGLLALGLLLLGSSAVMPGGADAAAGDYVYLARGNQGIARALTGGGGVTNGFITPGGFALGMVVTNEYIYWNSYLNSHIGRANLDGTGVNATWLNINSSPSAITTDGTYLYIGRDSANRIARVKLDGTDYQADFITTGYQPTDITVTGTHVYWANFGNGGGTTIGRANLDGSAATNTFLTGLVAPVGLANDGTYLYWMSYGVSGSIGRSNLDGTGVNASFVPGVAHGWDIEVANGKLWADVATSVWTVNLDGTGLSTSTVTGLTGLNRGLSVGGVYGGPAPTPTPTPEPTPSPTPDPTPTPTPTPDPTPTPTPTPTPDPEPSPSPTPDPTPTPTPTPSPTPAASLDTNRASVPAGGRVTVNGSGFHPASRVDLSLHSDPLFLGSVTTDATGAFETTVTIPDAAPAGDHDIVAVGSDPLGAELVLSQPLAVTLVAPPETSLPTPGISVQLLLFLTGIALLVLAVGVRGAPREA